MDPPTGPRRAVGRVHPLDRRTEQAVVWMRKADENGNALVKAALERYLRVWGEK